MHGKRYVPYLCSFLAIFLNIVLLEFRQQHFKVIAICCSNCNLLDVAAAIKNITFFLNVKKKRENCINKLQPASSAKYFHKHPLVRQNLLQIVDARQCYTMLQVIEANN